MKLSTNKIVAVLLILSAILTVTAMYGMREGMTKINEDIDTSVMFGRGLHALAGAAPMEVKNRVTKADEILDGKLFENASDGKSDLDCSSNPRGDLAAYASPLSDGKMTVCKPCNLNDGDCDACNETWCGLDESIPLVMNLPEIRDRRITAILQVPHSIP